MFVEHPSDETLERYFLQQSSDAEQTEIEAHAIACGACIDRMAALDEDLRVMRQALQEFHNEEVAQRYAKDQTTSKRWWSLSKISIAGAVAAIAISVIPFHHDKSIDVDLTAYRGLEHKVLPRDRTLHLTLNAVGIPGRRARVSLVDGSGREIWHHDGQIKASAITVDVPEIHSVGTHFVRIYENDESRPSREFAVNVE